MAGKKRRGPVKMLKAWLDFRQDSAFVRQGIKGAKRSLSKANERLFELHGQIKKMEQKHQLLDPKLKRLRSQRREAMRRVNDLEKEIAVFEKQLERIRKQHRL
jgi:archaellum component FlaC